MRKVGEASLGMHVRFVISLRWREGRVVCEGVGGKGNRRGEAVGKVVWGCVKGSEGRREE